MALGSIVFVGVAPHPPIMVPEVGGKMTSEVSGSIEAMRELARRIVESDAKTIILISPHAPLEARAFVAYAGPRLKGDFSQFRAPHAGVDVPLDRELLDAITRSAAEDGFHVASLDVQELDHGTAVPLYFLRRFGWDGRAVALGYSFLSDEEHVRFGASVVRAAKVVGRVAAFVASGDLSHRLKPGAPAGFQRDAHLFDEQIIAAISSSDPSRIASVDPGLRRLAGECGYRSMLVALGALDGKHPNSEVIHYEAPFGVGYLVAQLEQVEPTTKMRSDATQTGRETDSPTRPADTEETLPRPHTDDQDIPSLARRAVENFVRERRVLSKDRAPAALLLQRAACFVSIKTSDGDLRGCIGTVEPTCPTLAEEIIRNAIHAATQDPRFHPVEERELPHLHFSVDLLSDPEPTRFESLDPSVYGVIVEDEDGAHRGLLLPDIEGVETAAQQVQIAARKAGIAPDAPLRLHRFRVTRFRESEKQNSSDQGA